MLAAIRFLVILCFVSSGSATSVDLLELVERRAMASLDYGDQHPQVLALDQLIAERLAAGEVFDLTRARSQLELLVEERKELGKTLGQGHRQMILNAIRIRAISAILKNPEKVPLSSNARSRVQTLLKELPPAHTVTGHDQNELHNQLRGEWQIESALENGIDPSPGHNLSISDSYLREEFLDEQLAQIPEKHRTAFQAPWICFTYHRNLNALEFRKMVVNETNQWQPTLDRRFVSIQGEKMVLVFRDDVKRLPRSLESSDENHVFYYSR